LRRKINMIYTELCTHLNPRSGIIQPDISCSDEKSSILFDIAWKGDLHFIVVGWSWHAWYYVTRNKQKISETHLFKKTSDSLYRRMQRMIDDVENGKYQSKKTLSEKIIETVENRHLTSYMNNTKWNELLAALKLEICNIPIQYKTLFDEEAPKCYWTMGGDEFLEHMDMAEIDWFRISDKIREKINRGRLLDPKINVYEKKKEILQILTKYNIPYEYNEGENAFIIYGYK